MKILITAIFAAALAYAQGGNFRPNFSTAPANPVYFESSETLLASATRVCSSSTVAVTRTDATHLSIASAASSSAQQYVRFGTKTRPLTAAVTLTVSSGSGTGAVQIYGQLNSGVLSIVVAHNTTNAFTLSSGTVLPSNAAISSGAPFVLLYSWTMNSTGGNFDASGTDQQANQDCWVDEIDLANTTAGAITFTITDGQGTPVNGYKTQSLAANTSLLIQFPGGRFFDGGMQINASAVNSIDAHFRGVRLRQSAMNP